MNSSELIEVKKIANEIGYSETLLPVLFKDCMIDSDVISTKLIELMGTIPSGGSHEFSLSKEMNEQFLQSDCYMLAEHLLYAMHGKEGLSIEYVHVVQTVSVHGFVKIAINDQDFFVDGGGIYTDMTDILNRYALKEDEVGIYYYSGEDVIDDCDNYQVDKLSCLTETKLLIDKVSDALEYGNGDLMDDVLNNAFIELLHPSLIVNDNNLAI